MGNIDEETTVRETFEAMPDYFLKDQADGIDGVVQYNIVGENGGNWYVTIANRECIVTEGIHKYPTTVITTNDQSWLEICRGEVGGMEAFSEGKLSVNGDAGFVMSLDELFERGDRDE